MYPNNQFTSTESRFFYPVGHPVEHHESFEYQSVPRLKPLRGWDHYVHVLEADGTEYATELYYNDHDIPPGARILGLKGLAAANPEAAEHDAAIDASDFTIFDDSCSYSPAQPDGNIPQGALVVVRAKVPFNRRNLLQEDARFNSQDIAILPATEPLPSIAGLSEDKTHYRFLGFIDQDDVFVDGSGESDFNTTVIDWCVINQLAQSALERLLLEAAQPQGEHLSSAIKSQLGAEAYLHYYDEKHGTSYYPRFVSAEEFTLTTPRSLSEAEFRKYKRTRRVAGFYMNRPRSARPRGEI